VGSRPPADQSAGTSLRISHNEIQEKARKMKTNERKRPFICFHSFFRNEVFQRVTGDSNRKNFPFAVGATICVKRIP
jgi:hypothetical protein